MVFAWMIYWLVVATVLALAASVMNRAAISRGLPARWVWVGTLALLFAIPAAGLLVPRAVVGGGPGGVLVGPIELLNAQAMQIGGSPTAGAFLDPLLLMGWAVGSLGVLFYLIRSHLVLRWRRRDWRIRSLGGEPVWLSTCSGPAVIGFIRTEIVLPSWVEDLDPEQQKLLVEHEVEHIRGRDPWLLLVGLTALVAFPWNPAVWWQVSRLRTAMEIDCDRRVLRQSGDLRRYSDLLLTVACRVSSFPAAATAFASRPSQLEWRLQVMTSSLVDGRSRLRAAIGFAAAVLLVLGACRLEQPSGLRTSVDAELPDQISEEELAAAPTFVPYTEAPRLENRRAFAQWVMEEYPPDLRNEGVGGVVLLSVFVSSSGTVGNVLVEQTSGYEALDRAAETVMRRARFAPAVHENTAVPVWIQLPLTFAVNPAGP